jgi:putative ABC transport system ATP-binding protein
MIELRSVQRTYLKASETITALRDVTLTVKDGEFLAIHGPSGSGKSTLLNVLGCLDRPTTGQVFVDGVDTWKLRDAQLSRLRNRTVGFVFQAFNLIAGLTVTENVELPLVYAGVGGRRRRELTLRALDRVDMRQRADHPAELLSGGEQQRAAIARALVNNPRVILADEPTGSIDRVNADQVLSLLRDLHSAGRTVVVVTHDAKVARAAERVVPLVDGVIVQPVDPHAMATPSPVRPVAQPAPTHGTIE